MSDRATDLYRTITGIRRCFWLLATVSDEMLADLGLTASLRAVLEHLDEFGPQAVPQIAREKSVKRQSIQALVDRLLALGLVRSEDNPAHRRSVLIALTPKGAAAFRGIRRREAERLSELQGALNTKALAMTADTLTTLRSALQSMIQGEPDDDDDRAPTRRDPA